MRFERFKTKHLSRYSAAIAQNVFPNECALIPAEDRANAEQPTPHRRRRKVLLFRVTLHAGRRKCADSWDTEPAKDPVDQFTVAVICVSASGAVLKPVGVLSDSVLVPAVTGWKLTALDW